MENRDFKKCVHCKDSIRKINHDWKCRHLHKKCYKELCKLKESYFNILYNSGPMEEEHKDIIRDHINYVSKKLDYRNYI